MTAISGQPLGLRLEYPWEGEGRPGKRELEIGPSPSLPELEEKIGEALPASSQPGLLSLGHAPSAPAAAEAACLSSLLLCLEGEDKGEVKRLLPLLLPLFTSLFDNSPFCGGKRPRGYNLNQEILRKTDYPWLWEEGDLLVFRVADSGPPALMLGEAALAKGLFYWPPNRKRLIRRFQGIRCSSLEGGFNAGRDQGVQAYYLSDYLAHWGLVLAAWAEEGLEEGERHYLLPLIQLWDQLQSPREAWEDRQ